MDMTARLIIFCGFGMSLLSLVILIFGQTAGPEWATVASVYAQFMIYGALLLIGLGTLVGLTRRG